MVNSQSMNEIHILRITPCKKKILRLSIHLILSCKMDEFASLWAVVCSSWVQINCFTSCRSLLLPEGDCNKQYIVDANCMMSRLLHFASYMKLSPFMFHSIPNLNIGYTWLYVFFDKVSLTVFCL